MPDEFAAAGPALAILSLGIVFQATQQITGTGISLERKTYLFAYLSWGAAAVNFVANWLLIPQFGVIGAAWATALSYFALTSGYLLASQRLHPLPLDWGRIAALLLLWGGIAVGTSLLRAETPSGINFLLKSGALIGVCALILALVWTARTDVKTP